MAERAAVPVGRDRFLIGIVVGAVALALIGIAAALLAGRAPAPAPLDPNSPAGVVQAYAEAMRRGDYDAADGYLSRSARAALSRDRERFPYTPAGGTESRVLYETTRIDGDTAEVRITVSRFTARADPFSSGTYSSEYRVVLVREDGAWKINQPLYPYMFW